MSIYSVVNKLKKKSRSSTAATSVSHSATDAGLYAAQLHAECAELECLLYSLH